MRTPHLVWGRHKDELEHGHEHLRGVCGFLCQLCWKGPHWQAWRTHATSLLAASMLQPAYGNHGRLCQLLQPVRESSSTLTCAWYSPTTLHADGLSWQLGLRWLWMVLLGHLGQASVGCTGARQAWFKPGDKSW